LIELHKTIQELYNTELHLLQRSDVVPVFNELKTQLNSGTLRTAEKKDGHWSVHEWIKQGILLGFRVGILSEITSASPFQFFDKDNFPTKKFSFEDGVRIVMGGTTVRDGCYLAKGVVIMPPAYVNIGAYIDEGTMIDSHALVGSCAQIGKRVHISAGAQIGGVLEPIKAMPVIIEDDVFVGGNCGIFEGVIVSEGAVIASGVNLTASTPVYDVVRENILCGTKKHPLVIPRNAVVVSGGRPISGKWAEENRLVIFTPMIIKYRDEKTNNATLLEENLR